MPRQISEVFEPLPSLNFAWFSLILTYTRPKYISRQQRKRKKERKGREREERQKGETREKRVGSTRRQFSSEEGRLKGEK